MIYPCKYMYVPNQCFPHNIFDYPIRLIELGTVFFLYQITLRNIITLKWVPGLSPNYQIQYYQTGPRDGGVKSKTLH